MGSEETVDNLGYSLLKDLSFEIGENETCFNLCFWVFLLSSTPFPSTILYQLHSEISFLSLSEDKRLILSPSLLLRKESSESGEIASSTEVAISNVELPLGQWVHIGCQVYSSIIRIYLGGKVVGERPLDSLMARQADLQSFMKIKGFKDLDGYVYNAVVFPSTNSIEDHHAKDPPLCLCIDSSSVSDVELEGDGIWKIFGGKASCRKMFSSDVVLLDAFGELVDKDLELSSECDNKLFCVKFHLLKLGKFPFFEAYTPPIRSILKSCDTKVSTIKWKKLSSGFHLFNRSSLPQNGIEHSELHQKPVCEAIPNPPLKRKKSGQDTPLPHTKVESTVQRSDEEGSSFNMSATKNVVGTSLESIQENYGEIDSSASDSDSAGARNTESKSFTKNEMLEMMRRLV